MERELYSDIYGGITHDEDAQVLVLEWSEATTNMTDDDFKESMSRYAKLAEEVRPANLLVDVTKFKHSPGADVGAWRDQEIIPRYNSAGVKKFAFVIPSGSPGTVEAGTPPAPEPPGRFPTAYFDNRNNALNWFHE
jgi:hypothetical protein